MIISRYNSTLLLMPLFFIAVDGHAQLGACRTYGNVLCDLLAFSGYDAGDEEVEYEYDSNGNLTADLNRGIAGIVYSGLNQPLRIEFADGKSIENIYDADGLLLQRCLVNAKMAVGDVLRPANVGGELAGTIGQRLATTTDYSGVWQFENGTLDRINIPGGFIKGNNVYFYISDHQGNVRQVWNATTNRTVQDNHYYPYGSLFGESASTEYLNVMSLSSTGSHSNGESGAIEYIEETDNQDSFTDPGTPIVSPLGSLFETSDNAYRYGGKEWITYRGLNAYDFTARLYDPALGRFHNPDPLNASYPHLSPYLYCTANPINATDPTGLKWDLSGLSDDELKRFEVFYNLPENALPELSFIYNLIEEDERVFKVEFVDEIHNSTVEGVDQGIRVQLSLNEDGGLLSISKSNPPNSRNIL